jgi:NADH-quinone oxidoreductase subunit H
LLNTAAILVWAERRLLGWWQERYGPNRVWIFGLGQTAADTVKLLTKHDWIPPFADKVVFVLAPAIAMVTIAVAFAVVPVAPGWTVAGDWNIGLLFFLAMTSMAVYSVLLAGWSSRSKYALLGALRAAAQSIAYEVFLGLSLMGVVLQAGTFSLQGIVEAQARLWFVVPQAVGFLVFMVAAIAETRRLPLDLPEAEHELAAGFHTEYSGMKFGMFFIGEYIDVTLISAMIVTLFFGGWHAPFGLPGPPAVWFVAKAGAFIAFFILLRAAIPRPRYDQLMGFGWKVLLPLSLVNLLVTGAIVLAGSHG